MKQILASVFAVAVMMGFLVARYGEFVLLKPPLKPHTLLLWLLPPLALAGGGLALWTHSRRRARSATNEDQSPIKLTAEEEARLERLMAADAPSVHRPSKTDSKTDKKISWVNFMREI